MELKKILEGKDWSSLKRYCDDKVTAIYESYVESKKDKFLSEMKGESTEEDIEDENEDAEDEDKDPGEKKTVKGKKPFQQKEVGDSDDDKKKVGYDG